MLFGTYELGSGYGLDYARVVTREGIVNNLFRTSEQYEQMVATQKRTSAYASDALARLKTYWLISLYDEDRELYEIYDEALGKNKNVIIEPTRIAFESDSVEWGLTDELFLRNQCSVYPSTSYSKTIVYSSSDTSVLEIDKRSEVTLKKTGTATITASLLDYPDIKAKKTVL